MLIGLKPFSNSKVSFLSVKLGYCLNTCFYIFDFSNDLTLFALKKTEFFKKSYYVFLKMLKVIQATFNDFKEF